MRADAFDIQVQARLTLIFPLTRFGRLRVCVALGWNLGCPAEHLAEDTGITALLKRFRNC